MELNIDFPTEQLHPGEVIQATARITADGEARTEGGYVDLVRTVTYRVREGNIYGGTFTVPEQRAEVVHRVELPAGYLRPGSLVVQHLALAVPTDALPTVDARLVRIDWLLHGQLRVAGANHVEVARRVVVLPARRGEQVQTPARVDDYGVAVLGFESLSNRHLLPGAPITGDLTVEPLRSGSARAARVDLVLVEQVHPQPRIGDIPLRSPDFGSTDAETVVSTLEVSKHVALHPTRRLSFPFTLAVPARLLTPSMQTPDFLLRWELRGILDRQLRSDPMVSLELQA